MDEFSDVVGQSADTTYCQAWEACAQHHYESYQDVFSSGYSRYLRLEGMGEDIATNTTLFPYEGESRGFADDATWILTSSFVIFTMQSGFGLLESGSCSPGFEVNIMMKNIVDVVFSSLSYYLVGYGISFGQPSNGFMGLGNFPASGGYEEVSSGRLYSKYIFQLSFAATSCTIVSGAVAMRLKFFIYCLYSLLAVVFYSFVAHWTFDDGGTVDGEGGGFLYRMGAHDFAGGAAVHVFGGINGLIATMFLGPRTGRFDGTRPITDFMPSSPSSQCFGLLVLWWGWIGFNCGSSFGITDQRWVVAIRCAVTTINSTVGGGLASILYTLWRTKGQLVIPEHVINGILGALVAITPACACVHTYIAFPTGAVGALVGLGMNNLVCRCKIDDPVGVTGVHAASGMWGLIAVGLFADSGLPGHITVSNGLFYGGGFGLLGLQALTIICTVAWAIMWSSGFFYLVGVALSRDWRDPRKGLRVGVEEEEMGADAYLHGVFDHGASHTRDTIIGCGRRHSRVSADNTVESKRAELEKGKTPMSVDFDTFDDSDEDGGDSGRGKARGKRGKARGKTQIYGNNRDSERGKTKMCVKFRDSTSVDIELADEDDSDRKKANGDDPDVEDDLIAWSDRALPAVGNVLELEQQPAGLPRQNPHTSETSNSKDGRRGKIKRQSSSSREMMYVGARGDAGRAFRRNSEIGLLSGRAQENFSPRKQEGGANTVEEDGGGAGHEDSTRYLEFLRVLEGEGRGSEASYHKFLDILEDIRSRSSLLNDRA